jgi:hypothetical protein
MRDVRIVRKRFPVAEKDKRPKPNTLPQGLMQFLRSFPAVGEGFAVRMGGCCGLREGIKGCCSFFCDSGKDGWVADGGSVFLERWVVIGKTVIGGEGGGDDSAQIVFSATKFPSSGGR